MDHGLAPVEAERAPRLHLPVVNRLYAGTEDLREVGAGVYRAGGDCCGKRLNAVPEYHGEGEVDYENLHEKRCPADEVHVDLRGIVKHAFPGDFHKADNRADDEADRDG